MKTTGNRLLILAALVVFGMVVVGNAWLSDDAYITLRTVDNLLHGYGLTWNVVERVQTYTHPLWMLLLAAICAVTHEVFFSSFALSIVVSLAAVAVLAKIARSTPAALLGVAVLTLSKSFVDYATSGLENPLTHLLLALFLLVYFGSVERGLPARPDAAAVERGLPARIPTKTIFLLALLAAMGMTNRLDTALLFAPALAFVVIRSRSVKSLWAAGAGLTPLILWELFSLFYYGFPFPNTAPAKMAAGLVSRAALLRQGLNYPLNSLRWDPLTLVVIVLGLAVLLLRKEWRNLPIAAGLLLYLAYVVWIGGDFMSGRFLAAPLLAAVALLVGGEWKPRPLAWAALFLLVVGLGLASPRSPVFVGRNDRLYADLRTLADANRISDERANYYHNTGLLLALRRPGLPDHDWAEDGREARLAGPAVIERGSVGFFGYFAGPQVYVVDLLALGDPLLARLPPADPQITVGHLGRIVPDGYIETLESGENRIADPNLALYYDKLCILTRGNLWDAGRLVEIWKFNTGAYDSYRDAYAYYRGEALVQSLRAANPTDNPYVYAYVWNNGAAEAFLLDDASHRGSVYTFTWTITAAGADFDGPYVEQVAVGGPLSDRETLNVGVFFSATPERTVLDMFERRFWFRLDRGGGLTVILPATGWRNPQAPGGVWAVEDIGGVLDDNPLDRAQK